MLNWLRRLGLALPSLAALALFALSWFGLLEGADSWMRGRVATWSRQRSLRSKVALVLITNDCLDQLKRWPLRRKTYALAIDRLRAAAAKVIAIDVLFLSQTEGLEEDDELLRRALEKAGNVVLPCLLRPSQLLDESMRLVPRFKVDRPWPPFAKACAEVGFANMEVLGLNGLASIERAPLELAFVEDGRSHALASFALQATRLYLEGKGPALEGTPVLPHGKMRISELPLPEDFEASLRYGWIDFRPVPGGEVFPTYPLSAICNGQFPPDAFRDKLVFVGTQATGTEDFKITPLGPLPGVAINACVAHGLLHGSSPHRPPPWAHPLGFFLASALGIYLLQGLRRLHATLAFLFGLPLLLLGGAVLAYGHMNRLSDPFVFLLLPAVILLARVASDRFCARVDEALERSWIEEHDAAFVKAKEAFAREDFEDAAAMANELVRAHGGRARESAILLVRALLRVGQLSPARQALQNIDGEGLQADDLVTLGRACLDANLLDSADGLLSKAYLTKSDHPEIAALLDELAARRSELEGGMSMNSYSSIFDRRYRDVDLIGRGGMAIVYRAYDPERDEIVALKLLSPVYKDDRTVLKRFMREVDAVNQLEHPNIVRVYHVQPGELPYFSMEFLSGQGLRKTIEEDAPLPVDRALAISDQLLDALAYAHGRGVIHRDVKPENIVLEANDQVKLVDFGLARLALLTAITQEGASLGTPWYMSPEQFQGKGVDGRSDLYSAGVLLYELLTKELPYPRESIGMQTVMPPTAILDRRPDLPAELGAFVMRCIAPKVDERFPSCAEALSALRAMTERARSAEPSP